VLRVIALFPLLEMLFQYEIHKLCYLIDHTDYRKRVNCAGCGGGISLWQPFYVTSGRRDFEQAELDYNTYGADHNRFSPQFHII